MLRWLWSNDEVALTLPQYNMCLVIFGLGLGVHVSLCRRKTLSTIPPVVRFPPLDGEVCKQGFRGASFPNKTEVSGIL
jgi:hypothetical protein